MRSGQDMASTLKKMNLPIGERIIFLRTSSGTEQRQKTKENISGPRTTIVPES